MFLTNSTTLVTHVSVSDTPLSDHIIVDIFLSHNPFPTIEQNPSDFNSPSFRSLDFTKENVDELNSASLEIYWHELWDNCANPDEFSERNPKILLQVCESYCPRKIPPSKKQCHSLRSFSHKKKTIKKQLDKALHEHSFKIMRPRIWNCVPSKIRKKDSLEYFKNHLTKIMYIYLQWWLGYLMASQVLMDYTQVMRVRLNSSLDELHAGYAG